MPAPKILLAGAVSLLAACSPTLQTAPPTVPAGRAAPQPTAPLVSPESQELRAHYAQVEARLRSRDLLRTDGGGVDTPFTSDMLARNFKRIALHEEFSSVGGQFMARETASKLRRWEIPVRVSVEFRGVIPEAQRQADRRSVTSFVNRLSRVTDHPIAVTTTATPNFHVFIVDELARRGLADRLREIIPSISPAAISAVTDLPRSSYCLVFAWDPDDDGSYAKAVAVIRAEHPTLLRQSCIHEEIAQGLGLSNDNPSVRPSVFNDDEEFGLLTRHDEQLLGILYDPRLRPGMMADQAMPIVTKIARERLDGAG